MKSIIEAWVQSMKLYEDPSAVASIAESDYTVCNCFEDQRRLSHEPHLQETEERLWHVIFLSVAAHLDSPCFHYRLHAFSGTRPFLTLSIPDAPWSELFILHVSISCSGVITVPESHDASKRFYRSYYRIGMAFSGSERQGNTFMYAEKAGMCCAAEYL